MEEAQDAAQVACTGQRNFEEGADAVCWKWKSCWAEKVVRCTRQLGSHWQ
eukprot:CAMPEP_0197622494 /NCGR_PEP_ID=MMETSP1338-20131121/2781_1 /TAXON_ID=43686 ORGANISM="Pelagodinium beii, Strain RCC1491" /NCGR_SAMPLE_ID=MMETSP1338 /ASSEMBLY_ACC=CAM_ASM_000754 /LENGTH=49 /DNA_ID=CAMNT_0043192233 /DNA_START=1239 /DNA_END=1388 /DNA_ORIENTATION=+